MYAARAFHIFGGVKSAKMENQSIFLRQTPRTNVGGNRAIAKVFKAWNVAMHLSSSQGSCDLCQKCCRWLPAIMCHHLLTLPVSDSLMSRAFHITYKGGAALPVSNKASSASYLLSQTDLWRKSLRLRPGTSNSDTWLNDSVNISRAFSTGPIWRCHV